MIALFFFSSQTGKLFYVNGKSGERRTEVPRIAASGLKASYNSSEEYNSDDAGGCEDEEDNDSDIEDCSSLAGDGTDYEDFFGVSSRNSHNSSSDDSIAGDGKGGAGSLILVVAGCKCVLAKFKLKITSKFWPEYGYNDLAVCEGISNNCMDSYFFINLHIVVIKNIIGGILHRCHCKRRNWRSRKRASSLVSPTSCHALPVPQSRHLEKTTRRRQALSMKEAKRRQALSILSSFEGGWTEASRC
ncbi:hypothetical protein MA16_Dca003524 [Dendrobium catenatum]|uniref:Uncharacterized protein n=1 Tax=Dendrobium catenatum TaxID=906689 RepID=A0A2I0WF73_9ASPA|nr:hypothetical protein MA16_Dca003524 [Dendrobium catenatum]